MATRVEASVDDWLSIVCRITTIKSQNVVESCVERPEGEGGVVRCVGRCRKVVLARGFV